MEATPFTPESLYELGWISDPQVAPDGVRVAWVQHWIEEGKRTVSKRWCTGPRCT